MTQATQTRTLADIDADLARLQEERQQALQRQHQATLPTLVQTLTWEEQQGGLASAINDGEVRRFPSGACDRGLIRQGPPSDPGECILRKYEYHHAWGKQVASDVHSLSNGDRYFRWPTRIYGVVDGIFGCNNQLNVKAALAYLRHVARWHKQAIDRLDQEARTATTVKARSSTVRQAALERLAKVLGLQVAAL